jgi:hypothetical protein
MKRLWFPQQKPYGYVPLRWGLEYIELPSFMKNRFAPKVYTTRTHPLKGAYYAVEGSRFDAHPVEPKLEFTVVGNCMIDLRNAQVTTDGQTWFTDVILAKNGYSFAELDLGVKGATFEQLRGELLRSYPKATLDTPFYVSRLEGISVKENR